MKESNKVDYQSSIYLQLREVIRNKIEDGEYLPGTAIPSEYSLAEKYEINRLTVRNAIDELVKEGLLKRVKGKGIYVLAPIERDLEVLGGFSQTMNEKNVKSKKKILHRMKRKAGSKYAQIFDINENDEIYYIKRLDYADDEPIAIQEVFTPYNMVPNIEEIDLIVFSMFEVYEFYDISISRAFQTLDLIHLTQADSRLLNIANEQPVFLFSCITYDENNKAIEYSKSYTRGDKCNFVVHFHK